MTMASVQVGVTMAQTVLHPDMLESCVRDELNHTSTRYVHDVRLSENSGQIQQMKVCKML